MRRPRRWGIDELLKLGAIEERIYRLRCVEGWSMVIPWVGYSLSDAEARVEPTAGPSTWSSSRLADPQQMPGVRSRVLTGRMSRACASTRRCIR
jgi:sulfoxide reductase catalytic subunit YedY